MRSYILLCFFIIANISLGQSRYQYRYWFDLSDNSAIVGTSDFNYINIEADISELALGIHSFNLQLLNVENGSVIVKSAFFCKTSDNNTISIYIDDQPYNVEKFPRVINGIGHLNIDMSSLSDGLHKMVYILHDSENKPKEIGSKFFIKIPIGGEGIWKYEYWLNKDYHNKKTLTIDSPISPCVLLADLPIGDFNTPYGSYDFKIEGNKPYLYPIYNFNIRFYNTWGFQKDTTSIYVDCSKRQLLDPKFLIPNKQYDIDPVKVDSFYWFKFNALEGDSLIFKARRQSTMTFYSTNAERIHCISGDSVLTYNGFTAKNNGTYYLKIDNILKSKQIYSFKFDCVSGPSKDSNDSIDNGSKDDIYDGILIDWMNSLEWQNIPEGITLSKNNFNIKIKKDSAFTLPYVATNANDVRMYSGSILRIESDKYIQKLIFCLSDKWKEQLGTIKTKTGIINIDTIRNILVWEGPASIAEIYATEANNFDKDEDILPKMFSFTKIYATLLDIKNDVYSEVAEIRPEYTEYMGYNTITFWYNDGSHVSYSLNDEVDIKFEGNFIVAYTKFVEVMYDVNNIKNITYSMDVVTDIEKNIDELKHVNYQNGRLLFQNLPIGSHLRIYTVNGIKVVDIPNLSGDYIYQLSSFTHGVYIVNINGITSKILLK